MIWNTQKTRQPNGFSLIELIVIISIIGILSSIALVNLTSSRSKGRLLATTRELENWLGDQRSYAKTYNLTCLITIDKNKKRLISTRYSSETNQGCTDNKSNSESNYFDLAESYGKGSEKLSLISTPNIDPAQNNGGILFSLQGFSQNHQLQSKGTLELRLTHEDLQEQRCIRIVSPIGMIRDGRKLNDNEQCRYDNAN